MMSGRGSTGPWVSQLQAYKIVFIFRKCRENEHVPPTIPRTLNNLRMQLCLCLKIIYLFERFPETHRCLKLLLKDMKENATGKNALLNFRPLNEHLKIFSNDEKVLFVKYIQTSSNMHYRLTKLATRRLAHEFAVANAKKIWPNFRFSVRPHKTFLYPNDTFFPLTPHSFF